MSYSYDSGAARQPEALENEDAGPCDYDRSRAPLGAPEPSRCPAG